MSLCDMPVALPISRDIVKELWLQGFSHKDIENQTGVKSATLRSWIIRGAWKQNGQKVIPPKEHRQPVAIQDHARRLEDLTLTEADRIICHLRDTDLKTLRDAQIAASALSSAYLVSRKARGLDDDRIQRVLHVHTMREARSSSITIDAETIVESVVPAPGHVTDAPKAP